MSVWFCRPNTPGVISLLPRGAGLQPFPLLAGVRAVTRYYSVTPMPSQRVELIVEEGDYVSDYRHVSSLYYFGQSKETTT